MLVLLVLILGFLYVLDEGQCLSWCEAVGAWCTVVCRYIHCMVPFVYILCSSRRLDFYIYVVTLSSLQSWGENILFFLHMFLMKFADDMIKVASRQGTRPLDTDFWFNWINTALYHDTALCLYHELSNLWFCTMN